MPPEKSGWELDSRGSYRDGWVDSQGVQELGVNEGKAHSVNDRVQHMVCTMEKPNH